jgi:peptide/nickel transport system ATP-binding protein
MATVGLTALYGGSITTGQVLFEGTDLVQLNERALSDVRGRRIGMIFQQPTRSLNPAFTVGEQLAETLRRHKGMSRRQAWARAVELLERVQIPNAAARARDYPATFSGGMAQRVMIAIALSCEPRLLIADEPTTALDVTVQARTLDLLREIQRETGIAILFISHDLSVVADICSKVVVMYAGQIVEEAPTERLFSAPEHPYVAGLAMSTRTRRVSRRLSHIPGTIPSPAELPAGCRFHPRCDHADAGRCDVEAPSLLPSSALHLSRCLRRDEIDVTADLFGAVADPQRSEPSRVTVVHEPAAPLDGRALEEQPLVSVRGLGKRFRVGKGIGREGHWHHAVKDVSFDLFPRETLAIVGESGAGKSTTARLILRLIEPDEGSITFRDFDLRSMGARDLRSQRRHMQMIFQDPYSSLDPRFSIVESIAEPLAIHFGLSREERLARAAELLDRVGLGRSFLARYPGELSGGQLQRVAIARALSLEPDLIVCDEPVAALDVSVRAQVLNLMKELQESMQLTYLFISHDLGLVEAIADRVVVMAQGEVVEEGTVEDVYDSPQNQYTKDLLNAIPRPIVTMPEAMPERAGSIN